MLLLGIRTLRTELCATWLVLCVAAVSAAYGQTSELAGMMPEDYLPTLRPILETAVKQSPQMLLREIQMARAEARVLDANHERWPNVGGDIRYDSNQTAVDSNTSTKSRDSGLFYQMGASQALFHWGAIKHGADIAKIERAISEKDYVEAYRQLALEIRQGFVGLVWRKARLEWAQKNLQLKQADLASFKDRFAHGTASTGDIDMREWDVNETQLQVEQLRAEFDGERRRVGRLAGLKAIPEDVIPAEIPTPRYDAKLAAELVAAVLRAEGKTTFRAQVAEMKIREADLSYKIARVRLLPKFNASLSHSRESSTTATPNDIIQTAITRDTLEVRGSWTIFDGFATKAAKLSAKADKREWQRQLGIATEAAMDDAQQLARTVDLSARALTFADHRRAAAEALVKRTEEEMSAGRASQSNVDGANANLYATRYNTAQVRANYLADWAAFVSAVTVDPVLNNLPPRYARANR